MHILICDDSALIRERLYNRLVELNGFTNITESDSVSDSITQINNRLPSIAIVDMRLPDGTGLEILKYLKIKYPEVLTIIFTNYPSNQYRKKCKNFGADYFFDKSSEFDEVIRICSKKINEAKTDNNAKLVSIN